ncbi:MAG: 4Fe-4S dicluster domain-containing protein [Syntrophothermus sp.]
MDTVPINIAGREYQVPPMLTMMEALEYTGHRLIRGCGCRGGVCGACVTFYRTPDTNWPKAALACRTQVQPGMEFVQLPFFPALKAQYDLETCRPTAEQVLALYPEIKHCIHCHTCNKTCPQHLKVMEYVALVANGEIARAADLSFECVMCGACAARCPAGIVHYQVGLLARRLNGRYLAPPAQHLAERIQEIEDGLFDQELEQMVNMSEDELQALYNERDIEPE